MSRVGAIPAASLCLAIAAAGSLSFLVIAILLPGILEATTPEARRRADT